MKTVIVAGGFGTRLAEQTDVKPKPMVEVGGQPILWHIMNLYASFDFTEFVVALGYRAELIKSYFVNYHRLRNNLTVSLGSGDVRVHDGAREDWQIDLVDTGLSTEVGGRLKRLKPWLGNSTFMMTYGDGVAQLNIADLVAFHRHHGRLATLTAVRPPARFGSLHLDGDQVERFEEKPQTGEGWINGGFFVLEPEVLDYIGGDGTSFERETLERLARDGQLMAYRHEGFWQSMDTLRDVRLLNALWDSGQAPWVAALPKTNAESGIRP